MLVMMQWHWWPISYCDTSCRSLAGGLCQMLTVCVIGPIERFRAGHFTCKDTDWEKWREPIRKVEPETTDWALHTRIPVWIEPSHFLTATECWSIAGSEDTQRGNFYFSVSFFFSPFFPFVSGRWPDLGVLPRLQACFLFIYLFIFFACHATVVVVTGFVLKRLFASIATVCLEVGPSAVKHHRFFLEYSKIGCRRT